ncbi:MAG: hypothetical protein ABI091_23440, partial [Ferruginibacter sp.]
IRKMNIFLESFVEFKNDGYNIKDLNFEINEDGNGFGFSEGMIKYDAVMENNETIHYEGPYKFYMQRIDKFWDIFYFIMPGFDW